MSQTKAQLLNPQGDFTLTGQLIGVGATFSGNVSIAGTLTKQDVTNVDSVGVITARSDIIVGGNIAHLGDTDTKIAFTNNQIDFQANNSSRLYVNQYATYLQTAYPLAFLSSSGASPSIKSGGTNNQDLLLTTGTSNPTRIHIKSDGKIGIGTDNPTFSDISSVSSSSKKHGIELFKDGTDTASAIKLKADNGSGTSSWSQLGYSGANATSHWANYNTAGTKTGEIVIGSTGSVEVVSGNLTVNNGTNLQVFLNAGDGSIELTRASGGAFIDFKNSTGEDHDARLQEASGGLTCSTGALSDSKGNLRDIPLNDQSSSATYTAALSDAGKAIHAHSTTQTVAIDGSLVWTAGMAITIINSDSTELSINATNSMSLRNSATATAGNKKLAQYGMATILFTGTTTGYISGAGLSDA